MTGLLQAKRRRSEGITGGPIQTGELMRRMNV